MSSNKSKIMRNSNLELLRILSMILIVAYHFIVQSGIMDISTGATLGVECVLAVGGRFAVNIFVFISVWFMIDKEFKLDRVVAIWLRVFLYTVPITLLCILIFGFDSVGFKNLLQAFFPISGHPLWFASAYIVLLFLAPFLNAYMNNISRQLLKTTVIVATVLIVGIPSFLPISNFIVVNNMGANLLVFSYFYVLIGFVKMEKIHTKIRKQVLLITSSSSFILLVALRALPYFILNERISSLMSSVATYYITNFNTIFCMVCSMSLFLFFVNIEMKQINSINAVSSCTFGVYVIHQTPGLYPVLWSKLITVAGNFSESQLVAFPVVTILTIYVAFTFIDYFANKIIFKPLLNHVCSLAAYQKTAGMLESLYRL